MFACLLILGTRSFSQSYIFTPGTTFYTNLDTNQLGFLDGITFKNTGSINLDFSWERVYKNTLPDCSFPMCNNGECLGDLPLSGTMTTIAPGEKGFLKFHMESGSTFGTNIFKYLLKFGANADTLTYIITVGPETGIAEKYKAQQIPQIYPIPANTDLNIVTKQENTTIEFYSVNGNSVLTSELKIGSNKLDCSGLCSGLYFYKIFGNNSVLATGKVVIRH